MQRHSLEAARGLQGGQKGRPIDVIAENWLPTVPAQEHEVGLVGDR